MNFFHGTKPFLPQNMDNRIPPSPATQFMSSQSFAYYPQPHGTFTYTNNQVPEKSLPSTRSTTPSVDAEAPKVIKKEAETNVPKADSSKQEE